MKKDLYAAIFDVDGLILDSEAFYAKAWTDSFNQNSSDQYKVDEDFMKEWFYSNLSGKKIGQQLEYIQKCFPNNNIPMIYQEYRKLFTQRLESEPIEIRDGFFELINYLKTNKIKLGIASTSSYSSIKNCFKNSNIDINIFDAIISGDMGLAYKPNPAPYQEACKILSVNADNALAFEDSSSGLDSAVNAGIKCFLIPGRAPVSSKSKIKAYAVCNDLAETISIIESSFNINNQGPIIERI